MVINICSVATFLLTSNNGEKNVTSSSSQASKHIGVQGLSLRTQRDVEERLHVFLVPPQEGLQVNPTNRQRFGIINGVKGEAEYHIAEVTSEGRWFSEEELEAKIRERLPRRRR